MKMNSICAILNLTEDEKAGLDRLDAAVEVAELLVGVDQTVVPVEHRQRDAQAIERHRQFGGRESLPDAGLLAVPRILHWAILCVPRTGIVSGFKVNKRSIADTSLPQPSGRVSRRAASVLLLIQ